MASFQLKSNLKILGIILVICIAGYMILPSALFAIAKSYHDKGQGDVAKVYYDRLDKYFPHSAVTAEALERAAQLATSQNMLMISPMGIGSAHRIGGNLSKEAQYYYGELVRRFPNTHQGRRASSLLTIQRVKDHIYAGQTDEAVDLIEEYFTTSTYRVMDYDLVMEGARAFKARGHYQEGIKVLEQALAKNEQGNYPDFYELLGDLYGALGEQDKAIYYYQQVLISHQAMLEHERQFSDEEFIQGTILYIDEKKAEIDNKLARLTGEPLLNGSINGKVTLAGQALQDVHIFLQPLTQPNSFPMGGFNAIWGMTDSGGKFVFDSIAPGRYGLGLVVDLERVGDVVLEGGAFPKSIIYVEEGGTHTWDFNLVDTMQVISPVNEKVIKDDFIEFAWEPSLEAAYYTLELGAYSGNGSFSSPLPTKYLEPQARITLEELFSLPAGMSHDEQGPVPTSLFGYGAPGGKYFWGVRAHSEDGEIITASRGYLKEQNTDFSIKERELIAGDKLLLERKYAEAIKAYEEHLQSDPDNIHVLKMLASLYQFSIRPEHGEYTYTDFDRALLYYERLYELTGNVHYLDSQLGIVYYYLADFQKALDILGIIRGEQPLGDWQLMLLATLESHFGNYREGLDQLLKANQRFYQEEAALRIITGELRGIKESKDPKDARWQQAIGEYRESYAPEARGLREVLKDKTTLEALDYLAGQGLSPVGELLELSLKILEPSIRGYDVDQAVEGFIRKHSSSEPRLAQIARGLYQ